MGRKHWVELARRHGIAPDTGVDAMLDTFAGTVTTAVELVLAQLPKQFPARVADRVWDVVREAAQALQARN